VVAVGDQDPLVGQEPAPGGDPLPVADRPEAVTDPGLVDRVDHRGRPGHALEDRRRPARPCVDAEHRGEVHRGRLQQPQPVGHRRRHGPLVRKDPAGTVVEGHAGQHTPLHPPLAAEEIGLLVDIETWRRVEPEGALGPPGGQQLGHPPVVTRVAGLVARQHQPHHVVGARGLVGVTRLGRDDVVGRGGHQAGVADDGGIETEALEGGDGYHGAAWVGWEVMGRL
jgi:hypothetical protein